MYIRDSLFKLHVQIRSKCFFLIIMEYTVTTNYTLFRLIAKYKRLKHKNVDIIIIKNKLTIFIRYV